MRHVYRRHCSQVVTASLQVRNACVANTVLRIAEGETVEKGCSIGSHLALAYFLFSLPSLNSFC